MLDVIADGLIQDGLRLVGWTALKLLTFGRYRSGGPGALLVEGGAGLGVIVAACVAVYMWM